jgi:hypothetical protein
LDPASFTLSYRQVRRLIQEDQTSQIPEKTFQSTATQTDPPTIDSPQLDLALFEGLKLIAAKPLPPKRTKRASFRFDKVAKQPESESDGDSDAWSGITRSSNGSVADLSVLLSDTEDADDAGEYPKCNKAWPFLPKFC